MNGRSTAIEHCAESTFEVLGHQDRPVYVDRESRTVMKVYLKQSAAQVFAEMEALWNAPIGSVYRQIPQPRGVDLSANSITMELVPGESLGSRGELGRTVEHLDPLIELLFLLHRSGVVVTQVRDPRRLVKSVRRKANGMGRHFADTVEILSGSERGNSVPTQLVLNHGDFSPRNVLVADAEGPHLVLIDFDRLQMAEPARDIDYLGAWVWTTELTSGACPTWNVGDRAASVYRDLVRRESPEVCVPSDPFYRSVALLRIAAGWSQLQRDEKARELVIAEAQAQARMAAQ